MKNFIGILLGLCFSWSVFSENVIDVYGVSVKDSVKIVNQYERQIFQVENRLYQNIKYNQSHLNSQWLESLMKKRQALAMKIKRENHFAYVDIGTVYYPGSDVIYTTIEVIKKNQPDRLKWIRSDKKERHHLQQSDVIQTMQEFTQLEAKLFMQNQLSFEKNNCPVYHCVSDFRHPQLKPYLSIFNEAVVKDKLFIINTLNQDPDPERRSAAAFLLGHFSNPKEIVKQLTPHVLDSDPLVRNNAIRVIDSTIEQAKIPVDVTPFLSLLESPFGTDRNKSLLVLEKVSNFPQERSKIIRDGKDSLLAILALKQPNNHDAAYLILKKISGQDFGENNIVAWDHWFNQSRLTLT